MNGEFNKEKEDPKRDHQDRKQQGETNKQNKTKDTNPTHTNQKQAGRRASVEKPDTSLARQFKHLDTKQEGKKDPNPQIDTRQPNEAAHAAVREKCAIRGERKGSNKLEALTVFSQKIQAQE